MLNVWFRSTRSHHCAVLLKVTLARVNSYLLIKLNPRKVRLPRTYYFACRLQDVFPVSQIWRKSRVYYIIESKNYRNSSPSRVCYGATLLLSVSFIYFSLFHSMLLSIFWSPDMKQLLLLYLVLMWSRSFSISFSLAYLSFQMQLKRIPKFVKV